MTKTIFLLNIDDYAPEITKVTYPFIKYYAERIRANIHIITERKFPNYPVTYEKFQIYDLAKRIGSDWNIYIDSDALLHPEFLDVTCHLSKDTICQYSSDVADIRWTLDEIFFRDGRYIGAGNWFTVASDWCLDVWHPLDDITLAEALDKIHPTPNEIKAGITREHLIDDYVVSRNIARYGLKEKTLRQIWNEKGIGNPLVQHQYTLTAEEQLKSHLELIEKWGVGDMLKKYQGETV